MTQHRARRDRQAPVGPESSVPRRVVGPGTRARLSYRIDNALARGTAPVVRLLAAATVLMVISAGFVIAIGRIRINGSRDTGIEGFWDSLMRTLDPGTMGSDSGWPFRLVSLCVTIGGIFIVSTLIGLLANGIDRRLSELRRGRSQVIETGHVLVLGWSSKVMTLLGELNIAHENSKPACVVVLAPRDKIDMEDEIRTRHPNLRHIRVVVRSGDPSDPHELVIGSPLTARSIVIFTDLEIGDARTVHTVLALGAIGLSESVPIITELVETSRSEALRTASPLNVQLIISHEWIARIASQVCRKPALAVVLEDLLDFDGHEIYFERSPTWLAGHAMVDAVCTVNNAAVAGIRRAGHIHLAPEPDFLIELGDEMIVVAEEVGMASFAAELLDNPINSMADDRLETVIRTSPDPDHIGIINWSPLGSKLLDQLDQFLPLQSVVDVMIDRESKASPPPDISYQRFEMRCITADTTDVECLRNFLAWDTINRVIVLADRSSSNPAEADARVLLTLLELRQLVADDQTKVIGELIDPRNVDLIRSGGHEEFIVGDRLTSLVMAQLAEQGGLGDVFDEILAAEGPELDIIPAEAIGFLGLETTCRQLSGHLATHCGAYLIGIKQAGVTSMSPPGSTSVCFAAGDELIVVRHEGVEEV